MPVAVEHAPPQPLNAQVMIDALKECGATHLVWLPDTESGYLYQSLSEDPQLKLVPVTREGETFAIALGLLIGGKKPVVCIQNTGLYESGDSIRGLWIDLKLPILALDPLTILPRRSWSQS